jgi:hypothetical protein
MKQANLSNIFKDASKSVSTSTIVASPDPLSPNQSTCLALKTPENTKEDPGDPQAAGEEHIQMYYSSD